ncbi:DUF885 domain-containing protein [Bacterioplanes sanyensis]|uniref:DUF885 domain-containing protein n=1 Tax=Bacterioplanes sanyensis TaxID=1249553 RepID=A0A222FHG7_9GAMM|nr:DUF885 family protein [Bacterioplanes sanyensis]ASP37924.1 DUF885 domain-containing protein [Bacterioplanes sanyensis]
MLTFRQAEQAYREHVLSDLDTRLSLGVLEDSDRLGDPSLEAEQQHMQAAAALLEQLQQVETDGFEQQLDIELMQRSLKLDLFFHNLQQHGEPQRRRMPNGVDGISAGIFQLFINDEREPEPRLDDILSRLQMAPAYLSTELQVITQPITRWCATELEQGEGIPSLFDTIYDWAEQIGYGKLAELKAAIEACNAALSDYLRELKSRDTIDDFAIGEDKVKELLALRQIDKTPAQLAAMASEFMAETQQLLAELTDKLVKKYDLDATTSQADLHEFLNNHYAAEIKGERLDSVLDYYHEHRQKIEDFIQQNTLFPLPEQQSMRILQTPDFLEPVIPAGAMWPPLALREGEKTSMVYLTLKEDQLAEHNQLGIPMMMVHEGTPGHHLQFASAALHESFIRRIYSANEHAEGWTTMLEDYMLDIGYVSDDIVDEVRFVTKREILRLVARVGIDLYFMTGNKDYLQVGLDLDFSSDDPFENAAKLLKTATGFTDGRVQAELNWYSSEQGYPLSYLTGNRMVWQLKQDIMDANKKRLDSDELDRQFHDVYLKSGCMPVASLRKVFEHYGYL